ncbi:hypothetical protein CY652_22790 [Burkholderia sp. WAC0059]|uniref:hypothetical protein n=1 Tax=Burkholderia sp. WAC0059 TaxID=2066022 RepID=UPI000C7F37EF|nr:hypothetical protein [Burkholderia sp. WAC0059]PLZ00116.1 hypothetical protein CY652_22790 [Burkholderia sp. WAC0059]
MRHPALRRSARRQGKRGSREAEPGERGAPPPPPDAGTDPAKQNRPAPDAPADGEHNQGGARTENLDYHRDLGSEQDA